MEEQAVPGEEAVGSVPVSIRGNLTEARKRIDRMELMFREEIFPTVQREVADLRRSFKLLENDHARNAASWRKERESMEVELRELRSEVEQSRAAAVTAPPQSPQICGESDRGSEEIDLKAFAEHKWLESRTIRAPITPEAVRARTSATKEGVPTFSGGANAGKENVRNNQEGAEAIQRLRLENEQLRQKMRTMSNEYKGLKSQYHSLQALLRSKGDVRHTISNQDLLHADLEAGLEKPSKIRRRSFEEAEAQGGRGRAIGLVSSDMNVPSNHVPDSRVLPPEATVEIVSGPVASTSGSRDFQAKVKADPKSFNAISQTPPTKNNIVGVLDAKLEYKPDQAIDNSAMAGNRKRSLEPSGKQPAKPPAFKFVEPVRKKAEREDLQGTECKLCKKFYDAVLAGDANGLVESRCKHLEKSRHRYRDLPPATPEGFWNIGFDSDF